MIPTFPEFKILELSDRDEVERITKQFPPYSDYHFLQMWIWDIHEPLKLSRLYDNLILRHSDALTGESFFSFIGNSFLEMTLEKVVNFLDDNKFPVTLRLIPEEIMKNSNGISSYFVEDRDNYDYIFDVSKLVHAKGNELKNYRWHINKFAKNYFNISTKPLDLTDRNVKNLLTNLFIEWADQIKAENKIGNPLFGYEALIRLLESSGEFNSISALGLFDKNDLIAFSIFDTVNNEYALCSFLLGNRAYDGSFQFLLKRVAEYLQKKEIKWLNFEADYGISTWRNYKMSYKPPFFLKKYTIENLNKRKFWSTP